MPVSATLPSAKPAANQVWMLNGDDTTSATSDWVPAASTAIAMPSWREVAIAHGPYAGVVAPDWLIPAASTPSPTRVLPSVRIWQIEVESRTVVVVATPVGSSQTRPLLENIAWPASALPAIVVAA